MCVCMRERENRNFQHSHKERERERVSENICVCSSVAALVGFALRTVILRNLDVVDGFRTRRSYDQKKKENTHDERPTTKISCHFFLCQFLDLSKKYEFSRVNFARGFPREREKKREREMNIFIFFEFCGGE